MYLILKKEISHPNLNVSAGQKELREVWEKLLNTNFNDWEDESFRTWFARPEEISLIEKGKNRFTIIIPESIEFDQEFFKEILKMRVTETLTAIQNV